MANIRPSEVEWDHTQQLYSALFNAVHNGAVVEIERTDGTGDYIIGVSYVLWEDDL